MHGNTDPSRMLVRAALSYGSSARDRLAHLAAAINAALVFTYVTGLLGIGIFLHVTEALWGQSRVEEILI